MIKVVNCKTSEVIETVDKKYTDKNVKKLAESYGDIDVYYPLANGAVAYYKNGSVKGFTPIARG